MSSLDAEIERIGFCPSCKSDRTFTRQPKLITNPCILYSCDNCRLKVSVIYLDNKTYQKALRENK